MVKILVYLLAGMLALGMLLVLGSGIANNLFNRRVDREAQELLGAAGDRGEKIEAKDLAGLPTPVRKWLERAQVVGKQPIVSARTRHQVLLRLKPDQQWLPARVEQYFTVKEPGFVWKAKIKAAPFVHIVGRDKYVAGKGHLLIKLMSLFTVAEGQGPEVDQGTLLRYLAESTWLPTSVLCDYINWQPIDDNSAQATMSYKGVSASAIFHFDEQGDLARISARRYMDVDGEYKLEDWLVIMKDYREFNGFRIPAKADLIWQLKAGDFHWYQMEIEEMEYNIADVY